MTVVSFNINRPRGKRSSIRDLRTALAELVAMHYADDLTCTGRATKTQDVVAAACALLTDREMDEAMDRLFTAEDSDGDSGGPDEQGTSS